MRAPPSSDFDLKLTQIVPERRPMATPTFKHQLSYNSPNYNNFSQD